MDKEISILVVDDNINLCRTMFFVLKRKGYAIITAKDGLEAIEDVKERSFDIIFMDIKMPLMDGVETYKRIKKIRPKAIVIMMTAYAVEELVQEALQEGAYCIIYKPLDIERVIGLIESLREVEEGALVLVVDDDPGTCISFKKILIKKGYNVDIASTGEGAIAIAKEKVHNIIFIDIKMPTINGLETYLVIKKINPKAVVIMMTGYHQEMADLVEKAMQNNVYTCLYKPLDMAEVLKLINEIWERKQKK